MYVLILSGARSSMWSTGQKSSPLGRPSCLTKYRSAEVRGNSFSLAKLAMVLRWSFLFWSPWMPCSSCWMVMAPQMPIGGLSDLDKCPPH